MPMLHGKCRSSSPWESRKRDLRLNRRRLRTFVRAARWNEKRGYSTYETTVANLEEGPLDSAVFEVPAGFRPVAYIETSPPVDWQTAWVNAWLQFKAKVERLFN